jgi:3-dehydrosphinganine reductase
VKVAHVALYGYSAYAASKWALRGVAESLQMELKPYHIYVSVAFPPDTDTPGYETEMLTKPDITKQLSESGVVFPASAVAINIVDGSTAGYFSITTGLDGWFLKQLHPGMSPLNNMWEVTEGIVFGSLARVVSVFYLIEWDRLCATYVRSKQLTASEGEKKQSSVVGTPLLNDDNTSHDKTAHDTTALATPYQQVTY